VIKISFKKPDKKIIAIALLFLVPLSLSEITRIPRLVSALDSGTLTVRTGIEGVDAYLDSESEGTTDSYGRITVSGLVEGIYLLELVKTGYMNWSKQVSILMDMTTTVYAYLEKGEGNSTTRDEIITPTSPFGTLKVYTGLNDVKVYVGGEFGGSTDDYWGATVNGLTQGIYLLELVKTGYMNWSKQVSIVVDDTTEVSATLIALVCKADFEVDQRSVMVDVTVNFTNLSTGFVEAWLWDFGDGYTSTEQNPTHIYKSEGTYTVSLTVSNSLGSDTTIEEEYINVYATPAPVDLPEMPPPLTIGLLIVVLAALIAGFRRPRIS